MPTAFAPSTSGSLAAASAAGLVEVEDGDRGALLGEPGGGAEPDAARCSGDDGDPSVEATHAHSSSGRRMPTRAHPGTQRTLDRLSRAPRAAARRTPPARRSAYFVRGQKNPRSPSPLVRGTTCRCRCGTDWLTVLFIATKLPCAPSPSTTAVASRCGGAGGNRTRVLERRTRSSPGAVRDVVFSAPALALTRRRQAQSGKSPGHPPDRSDQQVLLDEARVRDGDGCPV
jgi:hypothetical protein